MKIIPHLKYAIKNFLNERENKESLSHKKSYSQCGEDLIIKFIFDSMKISKPTYIDIGAHNPYLINNTALFYEIGSRGINIDPDEILLNKFKVHRADDVNLNIGVGPTKSSLDLYIMSDKALNTFSKEEAENCVSEGFEVIKTKRVDILPIDEILKKHFGAKFPDFLSLDAEGFDFEIIKSIDFEYQYPKVICVETISFSNSRKGVKNKELIDFIIAKGYLLYADTYINTIFVKQNIWENKLKNN
jgi:FkbM family methyltransferase